AGSKVVDAQAVYGTMGVAAAGNVPGGRAAGASWRDASGNFWLFGGTGYDGIGMRQVGLKDLWSYSPATGLWAWVNGPVAGGGGVEVGERTEDRRRSWRLRHVGGRDSEQHPRWSHQHGDVDRQYGRAVVIRRNRLRQHGLVQ